MNKIELIPFIPATASYLIHHPKDFILTEGEDGVVSITSPVTNSNLTLSCYTTDQQITGTILNSFFTDITKNYNALSEIKKDTLEGKLMLEGKFLQDNIHWAWFAIALSNQVVIVSINSEAELTTEEYNLFKFMIDKLEIFPDDEDE